MWVVFSWNDGFLCYEEGCKKHWKTLKNEKKEKRRMQEKSNNNNKPFWFYFLFKNYILLESIIWKKQFIPSILFTVFRILKRCRIWYLKRSNDTPKLQIHKYRNYDIIEIYISRWSTMAQMFMAMDYLIMMSEKYLHFRKRQKHVAVEFFFHRVEVTGSMYIRKIFRITCISHIMYKILKEIETIQVVSKLTIFENLWEFTYIWVVAGHTNWVLLVYEEPRVLIAD